MIRAIGAIALSVVLLVTTSADAQNKTSQGSSSTNYSPSNFNSPTYDPDADQERLGLYVAAIVGGCILTGAVALAPFYLPVALLNENYGDTLYFTPHPYTNHYPGYQILSFDKAHEPADCEPEDVPRKTWALRLAVDNGNDFNGVNRIGLQMRIENQSCFGITSNWNCYTGLIPTERSSETWIGDVNGIFRFQQNPNLSFYTGLGCRVSAERGQLDAGVNFTYGGDWFPMEPLIVSALVDAGTLGTSLVVHGRASIGAIWQGCEFFVGYDFLRVGSTNLQGPLAGVRFWF